MYIIHVYVVSIWIFEGEFQWLNGMIIKYKYEVVSLRNDSQHNWNQNPRFPFWETLMLFWTKCRNYSLVYTLNLALFQVYIRHRRESEILFIRTNLISLVTQSIPDIIRSNLECEMEIRIRRVRIFKPDWFCIIYQTKYMTNLSHWRPLQDLFQISETSFINRLNYQI